jgi:hypothetical protein
MPRTYDLLPRTSSDYEWQDHLHDSEEFKDKPLPLRRRRGLLFALLRLGRRVLGRVCRPIYIFLFLVLFLGWEILFNAPYIDSKAPQFEVDKQETVFIAANIVDEDLIRGAWGNTLVELVKEIGVERVFVSVYGGPTAALRKLDQVLGGLGVSRSVVSEEEELLDIKGLARTMLPTGEERVKRIAYLAEVRNKALQPLDSSDYGEAGRRKWDKVLFINDVFFDVEGALRLLWGTKGEGKEVKAVCATDFVSSWKYYDTYATRDAEGYSIGVPIFPWFGNVGAQVSRRDVMMGKDRVRVKSCWGGMVAFQGRFFQAPGSSSGAVGERKEVGLPLRFRSEPEPFWDSSECCLIHADIIASSQPITPSSTSKGEDDPFDTGIYMNPFVRVSYDASTQKHIWLAKRFEALFTLPQGIINKFAKMPRFNYRRAEKEGEIIPDRLWISLNSDKSAEEQFRQGVEQFGSADADALWSGKEMDGGLRRRDGAIRERATIGEVKGKEYWANEGYYVDFNRTAKRGGYCGVRQLLVMKEGKLEEGEGKWDNLLDEVPPVEM